MKALTEWCKSNNLILNLEKTKEMIIDFRKGEINHSPLVINNQTVERVDTFKFLGNTICSSLKWEVNTNHILSKAQQRLYFLRQLKKFGVSAEAMVSFYRATVESVLTFSITVWYGNATAFERKQLERVVRTASKITGRVLPTVSSIFSTRIKRRMKKVMADPSHPACPLLKILPSGRRLRSLKSSTSRFTNSTYPGAIRLLNSDALFLSAL